jgi:hypothetical protein
VYIFAFPFLEETPMTLQVALGGKNGFVIASDRKALAGGSLTSSGRFTMQHTSDDGKILVSERKDMVCAFSFNTIARELARRLVGSPHPAFKDNEDADAFVRDKCDEFRKDYNEEYWPNGPILIVGFPNPATGITRLRQVSFHPLAVVTRSNLRFYGGDAGNSAVFFAERYHFKAQPIEELSIIAAHVVLQGGQLNPTCVGGLDVLMAKDGDEPRLLDQTELAVLESRSVAIHKGLLQGLLPEEKGSM